MMFLSAINLERGEFGIDDQEVKTMIKVWGDYKIVFGEKVEVINQ